MRSSGSGRYAFTGIVLGIAGTIALFEPGCGSDDASETADAGGDTPDVVAIEETAPAVDAGSNPVDGGTPITLSGRTFVARTLYLGDTDRNGTASNTAWRDFGADLDGKTTTVKSTDICTLSPGAAKVDQTDGTGGIDNSFGENIVPILMGVAGSGISAKASTQIQQGGDTFLLAVTGLTDDAAQTSAAAPGSVVEGNHAGSVPTFTSTDAWNVYSTSFSSGTTPKAIFTNGAIDSGTWSGSGNVDVSVAIGALTVVVHHARLTFSHPTAAHLSGTLSGTLDTDELIPELQRVGGALNPALCGGTGFLSVASQVRQASDMIKDGTNTSGIACDGISVGIGFDAEEVALPTKEIAPTPAPDPCAADD